VLEDDARTHEHVEALAQLVRVHRGRIAVHTGAGISTAAGIPDFRGPKGIWTLEASKKEAQPEQQAAQNPWQLDDFEKASPTFTHQSLVLLLREGIVSGIVSQNVDGLHGTLLDKSKGDPLAELHGNVFAEHCTRCGHEYVRDFVVGTIGQRATGRACSCGGKLVDSVLDWDDELPKTDLQQADSTCNTAQLSIALGTSLQIQVATNLALKPVRRRKDKGELVIVNLQPTLKDKYATLRIHARVDDVMRGLLRSLGMTLPEDLASFQRSCKQQIVGTLAEDDSSVKLTIKNAVNGGSLRVQAATASLSSGSLPFICSTETIGSTSTLDLQVALDAADRSLDLVVNAVSISGHVSTHKISFVFPSPLAVLAQPRSKRQRIDNGRVQSHIFSIPLADRVQFSM